MALAQWMRLPMRWNSLGRRVDVHAEWGGANAAGGGASLEGDTGLIVLDVVGDGLRVLGA